MPCSVPLSHCPFFGPVTVTNLSKSNFIGLKLLIPLKSTRPPKIDTVKSLQLFLFRIPLKYEHNAILFVIDGIY